MKKIIKKICMITTIINLLLIVQAFAQEETINIEYSFPEKGLNTIINTSVDLDINCAKLADKEEGAINAWQADDIVAQYLDAGNNMVNATYKSAFAGWKLISINNQTVSEQFIYPDNDLVYFDDRPFASYNGNISTLKFQAVWGKTVYVRDKYNFRDITNVYGYNVSGTNGDVLTSKIAWDTSTEYSSDTNSGASSTLPVSSLEKAYELLKNTYGGKICIVNHLTMEAEQEKQPYSPTFDNKAYTKLYSLGDDQNISGVVTLCGTGLGGGTSIENKAGLGTAYDNSWLYIKNTRGAGAYNGKSYGGLTMQFRFFCHTVIENLNSMAHRESYNSLSTRVTTDCYFYNTANNRLLIESTFAGYKRGTTVGILGVDTTNWSTKTVGTYNAISAGFNGCTQIYSSTSSYKKNGVNYTVGSQDNLYLNVKGTKWYNCYGFSSGSNQAVNNIHYNFENCQAGNLMACYGGSTKANKISVRTNNFVGPISINYNNSTTANGVSCALRGNGSATISNFYGGGYNTTTTGNISKLSSDLRCVVDGAKITNFYGGGNQVATLNNGDVHIIVNSGTITNLYGGGLGGYMGTDDNKTNITIDINGGTITNLYGGGSGGFVTLYSSSGITNVESYTKVGHYFYTSSAKRYQIDKATFSNTSTKYRDAKFNIQTYTVKDNGTPISEYIAVSVDYLYPGGTDTNYANYSNYNYIYAVSDAAVNSNITMNLKGGKITGAVYGGGKNGAVNGDIEINIYDGVTINGNVYAGGEGLQPTIDSTILDGQFVWTAEEDDYILDFDKYSALANKPGSAYLNAPAGADYPEFVLFGELKNNYTQTDGKMYIYSPTVSKLGLINGNTSLNVFGCKLKDIFGGSNGQIAKVTGSTSVNIENGSATNVYGGGNAGEVDGTSITIKGGKVTGTVFGGGNLAKINGGSLITIDNSTIGTLYGGGNQGSVGGDITINSTKGNITNLFGGGNFGAVAGSVSTSINGGNINTLYGGGNNGNVSGDSELIISQGTLNTAFGGGNLGVIGGNTNVKVGGSTNPYVTVSSLLYGGGRGTGADFETVHGNATVLIEGLNTSVENYGSSSLGKVVGDVEVTFRDYWTGNATDKYKTMNGIDRATNVIFDNSYVLLANVGEGGQLEGIKDITNLYVEEGSGLKVSADGELKGDFHGGGNFYLDSEVCLTINGDIYGSTLLVLNPLYTDGVNMIKGTEENPYMVIKGTDHSTNSTALYSNDSRYRIRNSTDSEGNVIYYIVADVIIDDILENTVINNSGSHYTDDASEWAKADVYIRNSKVFSSNVAEHIKFVITTGSTTGYNNLEREVSLVSRDSIIPFPKGTIIKIFEDNVLYSYKVSGINETAVRLTNIKNGNASYVEVNDIMPLSVKTGENLVKHTETYEYNNSMRFIVDFSGVAETDLLSKGPYNFMMNYYNNDVQISEMESKADNVIRIEEARSYTVEGEFDKDYYENNSVISITTQISSDEDIINEDYYGNPVYGVLTVKDSAGQLVEFNKNTVIIVDGVNVDVTNGNAKFKVLDAITQDAFSNSRTISIDIDDVFKNSNLQPGVYTIKIEFYSTDNNEALLSKLYEFSTSFEIRLFKYYHIYATVTGNGVSGKNVIKMSPSTSNRTVIIKYEGDLISPYIDVEVQKAVGNNNYVPIQNLYTTNKIENLQLNNTTSFSYSSSASGSIIKVTYILRNGNGEEKSRESLLFEMQ